MTTTNFVVTKDAKGMGFDITNCVIYSTRFKFSAFCRIFDSEPEDVYLKLLLEIPGIIEANVYNHTGLYDVHIKKASAFRWDEITSEIEKILNFRHEQLTNTVNSVA